MGVKESTGWWKLVSLSAIAIIMLMFLSSYSNIRFQPLLKMLPSAKLGFYTQERHYPGQFELTDEEVKEAEAELGNSEDLQKAIHLMRELQEAKRLYEEVRVLCWVLMYPDAHNTTAKHIKATWGRRCNRLIFMSTKDDPSIGAIDVGSREGYHSLWNKTRCALTYIYNNLLNDYEWFVKADSDSYILVDNLRYVMQAYDTDDPMYFGQYYKVYGRYNTGGAGHVMGREAVKRFVELAIPNSTICRPERSKGEDVGMGVCLGQVGIKFGDTRDHLGQGRFWQRHPATVMEFPDMRESIQMYPITKGERPDACCSDTLVSFHKLSVPELYLMDYLIYKVRVFGYIPILPLKVRLPPDLKAIPQKTLDKYAEYEEGATQTPELGLTSEEPSK